MANLFTTAPNVERISPPVRRKAVKATDKVRVPMGGTAMLVAIDAAIDRLMVLRAKVEKSIKADMATYFFNAGIAAKKRPDNFIGVEGDAAASCEMRKRGTALNDAEVELCETHGLEVEEVVAIEEGYVLNPDYAHDKALLGRASWHLNRVRGMPRDFILHQPRVGISKVSERALDALFTRPPSVIMTMMPKLSVLALASRSNEVSRASIDAAIAAALA